MNCDYVPIEPLRVLETRNGNGITKRPASAIKAGPGSITRVQVAGGNEAPANTYNEQDTTVPADVTAVSVTVTGVQSTGNDQFLTVWDCADTNPGSDGLEPDPPLASNVNLTNGDIRPNAVVTRVGTGSVTDFGIVEDKICVFARNETHLVVDVNGYFPEKADDNGHISLLTSAEAGAGHSADRRRVTPDDYAGGKPLANQIINVTGRGPPRRRRRRHPQPHRCRRGRLFHGVGLRGRQGRRDVGIEPDPPLGLIAQRGVGDHRGEPDRG